MKSRQVTQKCVGVNNCASSYEFHNGIASLKDCNLALTALTFELMYQH